MAGNHWKLVVKTSKLPKMQKNLINKCPSHSWFYIWLVVRVVPVFWTNHKVQLNKTCAVLDHFPHSVGNLSHLHKYVQHNASYDYSEYLVSLYGQVLFQEFMFLLLKQIETIFSVFSISLQIMCLHYEALSHYYIAEGILKSVGKYIKCC